MPKITILPHHEICPKGFIIKNASKGKSICATLLDNNVHIEHSCELSCACTTCHVIIRKGFNSLSEPSIIEEDLLDQAWGLESTSRLSCQALIGNEDIIIEIPKYSKNHAKEKII